MKGDKKESRSRVILYNSTKFREDERRKKWHKGLGPEPIHIRGSGSAVGSFLIMYIHFWGVIKGLVVLQQTVQLLKEVFVPLA